MKNPYKSPQEGFKPLRSPSHKRDFMLINGKINKRQREIYQQWSAARAERTAASAPVSRTEKAIAIGAIVAVAAGVLVYGGPKVAEAVSDIVEDAGYSQLKMGEGKGIFGELKDGAELVNDVQSGNVDPKDLTGLLTNDPTDWKESRSLTPGTAPTELPELYEHK